MKNYHIKDICIPDDSADLRRSDPSIKEIERAEAEGRPAPRVVGGDAGDLYFSSFVVKEGHTCLQGCIFRTSYKMTKQEAWDAADQVVCEAYESIGIELCY